MLAARLSRANPRPDRKDSTMQVDPRENIRDLLLVVVHHKPSKLPPAK
jgi:hypothetical protein